MIYSMEALRYLNAGNKATGPGTLKTITTETGLTNNGMMIWKDRQDNDCSNNSNSAQLQQLLEEIEVEETRRTRTTVNTSY